MNGNIARTRIGGKELMDRLTARNENGEVYFPHCFREDICDGLGISTECNRCDFDFRVCNKLAEYEDTRLTPEDIREIDKIYSEQAKELAEVKKENEKLKEKIESIRRMYEK